MFKSDEKMLKEMRENALRRQMEIKQHNDEVLQIPDNLTNEEKQEYEQIVEDFKEEISYRLSKVDVELIWQYCQLKVMRNRAWREYNKNPDRYIRIVTGMSSDGKTPKVMVKENEHYKTLIDCNKHIEKILKDLRLTPEMRNKK
ncbi:MAG: P27 family phage terminase small subunit [Clostridia bacterium]|nr:P27 family phage terminase small subunit [Clostridia bacterium]